MSKDERRVVKSSTSGNATIVEYSDGSKETLFPLADDKKPLVVVGSKTPKTTGKSTAVSTTGSNSSSSSSWGGKSSSSSHKSTGYQGGYHGGYSYQSNKPTLAFKAMGVEFWGSPKHKLDDILFEEGDLIINCTGTSWTPKAKPKPKLFTKKTPEWMTLPDVLMSATKPHNFGELAEQLLLDWPDMSPPPDAADIEFWGTILDQAIANGVKRVVCCCQAGQGRTGTALSSLLLATGAVDEPDVAIDYIRENYNSKAVETKRQEEYVFGLIYDTVDPTEETSSSNKTL